MKKIIEETVKNEKVIYTLQLLSISMLVFTLELWQIHGLDILSIIPFVIGISISLFCSAVCLQIHSIKGGILWNIVYFFALEITALIILVGGIAKENSALKNFSSLQKHFFVFICVFIAVLVFLHAFQLGRVVFLTHIAKVKKSTCIFCVVSITFFVVIGVWILNSWPRWDSFPYFMELEQKIKLQSIFGIDRNILIACGHPCGAFALLYLLFRQLPGLTLINTIYVSNIVLLVVDYILAYFIFRKKLNDKKSCLGFVAALAFVCSPYILGSVFTINAEHLALTGILLFLSGAIRNDYYLCFIACYIICNTRESCVPIAAIMILVQFIYDISSKYKKSKRATSIEWIYYGATFMVGSTWLLELQNHNWTKARGNRYFYDNNVPMFTYSFNISYIVNQLKGIFLTNFTWICVIVLIICMFTLIKREKQNILTALISNKLWIILSMSIIAALFVESIFLTHHNYRYYTTIVSLLYMLTLYTILCMAEKANSNKIKDWVSIATIGVIMLTQCFITVDPIMLLVFPTINTGKGRIAYMPWHMNNFSGPEFLENANYNFQILTFDKALNKIYENNELRNSRIMIYDGYQWGNMLNTQNSIWGFGYENYEPPSWGVWNEEGQYRKLSYNPQLEDIINPVFISDFQSVDENIEKYGIIYYLELPWGDDFAEKLKQHYPTMQIYQTVTYQTWKLDIYSIQ